MKGGDEGVGPGDHAVIEFPFVFHCRDLTAAVGPLLVDLGLFGPDEGPFVDIGVDLNVGVVRELESVLEEAD